MRLESFLRSLRKRLSRHPKFYLFDIGVMNGLRRQLQSDFDPIAMGRLFEHFIILETHRIASCAARDTKLYYWRTKDDAEVDLLIESKGRLAAAIEIKQSKKISTVASSGLRSFAQAHPGVRRFIVSRVEGPFELDGIDVLPWKSYFDLLPRIRA